MKKRSIYSKLQNAFTMVELIFVIVILGVAASIGSKIIVQVYESYIIERAVHNASIKTELAINQIANRLAYRIDQSMLARVPGLTAYTKGITVYPIKEIPVGTANTVTLGLEWIGYDNDGFSASNPPAWSGFVDLNASSYNTIVSTGSSLGSESTILTNLGGGTPAIYFLGDIEYRKGGLYDAMCMYNAKGCIFPVTLSGNTLSITGGNRTPGQMVYTEMYQLAASAYAIIPTPTASIDGVPLWDLRLYYNYQPWSGETLATASSSLLLRNVSVFRFTQEINSIRIKLCTLEQIEGTHISTCKEKAVIR